MQYQHLHDPNMVEQNKAFTMLWDRDRQTDWQANMHTD